jgi:hypothetical protein
MDFGLANRDQTRGKIPQAEFVEVSGGAARRLEHLAILDERFRPLNRSGGGFGPFRAILFAHAMVHCVAHTAEKLRPGRCLC